MYSMHLLTNNVIRSNRKIYFCRNLIRDKDSIVLQYVNEFEIIVSQLRDFLFFDILTLASYNTEKHL